MAKNRRLSFCKVVEVIAETTAPLLPMEELLAKIPSKRVGILLKPFLPVRQNRNNLIIWLICCLFLSRTMSIHVNSSAVLRFSHKTLRFVCQALPAELELNFALSSAEEIVKEKPKDRPLSPYTVYVAFQQYMSETI